jgi:dTDP-4-amino-4,6-dideoxygalactose transaminase
MVIEKRVQQRRANYTFYNTELGEITGIEFPDEPSGFHSNRWLTTILIDPDKTNGLTREDIRLALESENIESRPLWKPMHLQPVFKDCPAYTSGVSEKLFKNGLCLPSGSNLTIEELNRVTTSIKSVIQNH